ncbi:MAG: bifunctional riboflavin kinase/FAD synthetase [Dehalococcoidales bacterium]|nr:bifunctional riboflavin kinase/FAD synthetase [Dehalococcoidales bacterium]
MQVEAELSGITPPKDTLLTIGVFDGVHLGHKYLLSKLIERAKSQGMLTGVVTFRQHPQDFFTRQRKLPFLTDLDERIRLLKNAGIDFVVALTFDADLARLSAREFLGLLQKHLRMKGLVVGPDCALGKDREGNIEALRRLGQEMGFSFTSVSPKLIGGDVASSTAIRRALAAGDVSRVIKLAGRPFALHGRVIAGTGRGAGLGFPTANIDVNQEQAIPADGVYATMAYLDDKAYPSVTNVGTNPTFGKGKRTVEAFIIDFKQDIYGRDLRVDFIERLRGEKKFAGVEALKEQIVRDVAQGRELLAAAAKTGRRG